MLPICWWWHSTYLCYDLKVLKLRHWSMNSVNTTTEAAKEVCWIPISPRGRRANKDPGIQRCLLGNLSASSVPFDVKTIWVHDCFLFRWNLSSWGTPFWMGQESSGPLFNPSSQMWLLTLCKGEGQNLNLIVDVLHSLPL